MAKNNQYCRSSSESWLPPAAVEAKCWISRAKASLFFAFPICLLAGAFLLLTRSVTAGSVLLLLSALSIILIFLNDAMLVHTIGSAKFGVMRNRLKLFCLLGLFCLVFPGILYIIAYSTLKDMFKPQMQRYPSGYSETLKTYPPGSELSSEDGYVISKEE